MSFEHLELFHCFHKIFLDFSIIGRYVNAKTGRSDCDAGTKGKIAKPAAGAAHPLFLGLIVEDATKRFASRRDRRREFVQVVLSASCNEEMSNV